MGLVGLTCRHDGRAVLRDVTGGFAPGSLTALFGPNGGGKTTLLRAIAGLHRPATGTVRLASGTTIGLLPQAGTLDRTFPVRVRDVVALGAWASLGIGRTPSPALEARIDAALAAVGLTAVAGALIGALSGGQFQRVLFARLIVQDATLLLLDEPLTAVDAQTASDLLAVIRGWHHAGRTVIAAMHDADLVRQTFPQTLILAGAVRAWGPTAAVLRADPLAA